MNVPLDAYIGHFGDETL